MATSTTVREAPNPSAAPGAILKEFAVRFRQKRPDVNLYVTALPLKTLLGRFQADTYRADNRRGYQRAVTPSRLRQISSYMRDEEGMLPTSIVLCVRQPDRLDFEPAVGSNGGGETGLLRIGADIPLWIVDGQHRLYGLERALEHDKAGWLSEYPLPVVIVEGIDAYEEMRYFHVINTRHKGVPTDVVDRHLLSMREEEGAALLERQGERDYQRARATLLTDVLNSSPESPWKGMIRMPGESLKPEHMMKQHSMVSSLEPVVNEPIMKRLSDDEASKLLLNYWNASRERWASAPPDLPGRYRALPRGGRFLASEDLRRPFGCRSERRLLAHDARPLHGPPQRGSLCARAGPVPKGASAAPVAAQVVAPRKRDRIEGGRKQ
jgi:DGQHR domain-containing protein